MITAAVEKERGRGEKGGGVNGELNVRRTLTCRARRTRGGLPATTETRPRVGHRVEAVVLDVDVSKLIVDLSLEPELIAARKSSSAVQVRSP